MKLYKNYEEFREAMLKKYNDALLEIEGPGAEEYAQQTFINEAVNSLAFEVYNNRPKTMTERIDEINKLLAADMMKINGERVDKGIYKIGVDFGGKDHTAEVISYFGDFEEIDPETIKELMKRIRKGGVTIDPEATVFIELNTIFTKQRIEEETKQLEEKLGCKVVILNGHHKLAGVFAKADECRKNTPEDQSRENGPVIADAYNAETQEEIICKRNTEDKYDIFRRILRDEGLVIVNEKQINIKSFENKAEAIRFMYTKAAEYFGAK